jgi:micrococcal nuclease
MGVVSGFIASHKVAAFIGALAVGGVAVGGVAAAKHDAVKLATVTGIVDGDTIDVRYDGEEHRIRLLNVDTPETVAPGEQVECLGPEATTFLTDLLPLGAEVRLENDVELHDPYDRELAGVFLGDTLVNAEIARAGLGGAVLFEPNDRFYDDVLRAQQEAARAGAGLFSADIECTLPAQVRQYEQAAQAATTAAPAGSASPTEIDGWAAELASAAASGAALSQVLDGDRSSFPLLALTGTSIVKLSDRMHVATQSVATATTQASEARAAEQERLEAERVAAEAARKAAEEEAARRAAAEEAARQEAARQAADADAARRASAEQAPRQAPQSPPSSGSSGGSGGSSGGYDGYTGCRAYGGGYAPNAIDEKGRAYTKIDCSTKQPI